MPPTHQVIPARRDGVDGWLHPDGRWIPRLAGAEDDEAAKTAAAAEAAKAAAAAEEAKKAEEKAERDKLDTDAGKAALDKERAARKAAEEAAKEAQAKLDAIETEKLSETEKLKKQAEKDKAAASVATEKLRRANLISALSDHGLTGGRAKAAAKLLAVEYDDEDEPKDLEKAIETAAKEYGDDIFEADEDDPTPPRRRATLGGKDGNRHTPGPKLTAEEKAMAKSFGMTDDEYAKHKDPSYRGEPAKT